MHAGTAIGVIIGLLGVLLALLAPIAMWRGWFSRWAAVRPDAAIAASNAATLKARLLALDDPGQPFHFHEEADGTIAADWRIADAGWTQFFARFHVREAYHATLALSPAHHEVRVLEQRASSRSGPGEYQQRGFQGIILFEGAHHREWALTGNPPVDPREVVSYDFDVRRIKGPLIDTTLACGWTWVPVIFRSQLTVERALA